MHGPGMNNVILNNNYAVNTARWAEQQARMASQHCENLAKAHARTERWSRDLKITQEKGKFKTPADKKVIEYLTEERFDLKELQ